MSNYTSLPINTNNIRQSLLSADEILTTKWPEPVWAIPGILPVGLSVLAGPPKIGKSWLALQFAQAVVSGGMALGIPVECGRVLYLALEDPSRRLKERMVKQKWPEGLDAHFLPIGNFKDTIGDLSKGGSGVLAQLIKVYKYRLVVIDTFSRAFSGDQNDVAVMTSVLMPIQEMAHIHNCAVLSLDHHNKRGRENRDPVADILGSTAKGAIADTILGLYQERGKPGAKLTVTGREVEYKTIDLSMDWNTGCWQTDTSTQDLTLQQAELLEFLEGNGSATPSEIGKVVGRDRGSVYHQLAELEKKGKVSKDAEKWQFIGG